MSSIVDSGHSFDQVLKEKKKECPDSPDKKHKWKRYGSWPSIWEECKYCKKTIYWK